MFTLKELKKELRRKDVYLFPIEGSPGWFWLAAVGKCDRCGAVVLEPNAVKVCLTGTQVREVLPPRKELRPVNEMPANEIVPLPNGDYACQECVREEDEEATRRASAPVVPCSLALAEAEAPTGAVLLDPGETFDPTPAEVCVGDAVVWRPGFGGGNPVKGTVTGLEVSNTQHDKEGGHPVTSAPWDLVRVDRVVFSIGDSSWAYGKQVMGVVTKVENVVLTVEVKGETFKFERASMAEVRRLLHQLDAKKV